VIVAKSQELATTGAGGRFDARTGWPQGATTRRDSVSFQSGLTPRALRAPRVSSQGLAGERETPCECRRDGVVRLGGAGWLCDGVLVESSTCQISSFMAWRGYCSRRIRVLRNLPRWDHPRRCWARLRGNDPPCADAVDRGCDAACAGNRGRRRRESHAPAGPCQVTYQWQAPLHSAVSSDPTAPEGALLGFTSQPAGLTPITALYTASICVVIRPGIARKIAAGHSTAPVFVVVDIVHAKQCRSRRGFVSRSVCEASAPLINQKPNSSLSELPATRSTGGYSSLCSSSASTRSLGRPDASLLRAIAALPMKRTLTGPR
jgi:hypothetical protein